MENKLNMLPLASGYYYFTHLMDSREQQIALVLLLFFFSISPFFSPSLFVSITSSPHVNNMQVWASSPPLLPLYLPYRLGCRGDSAPAVRHSLDSQWSQVHTHLLDSYTCLMHVHINPYLPSNCFCQCWPTSESTFAQTAVGLAWIRPVRLCGFTGTNLDLDSLTYSAASQELCLVGLQI